MRHLIDAHCLIWALDEPTRLGVAAVKALEEPANDRLLGAQALVEGIPLVSADAVFDQYGVKRIWKF